MNTWFNNADVKIRKRVSGVWCGETLTYTHTHPEHGRQTENTHAARCMQRCYEA